MDANSPASSALSEPEEPPSPDGTHKKSPHSLKRVTPLESAAVSLGHRNVSRPTSARAVLPVSAETRRFRRRFFPSATPEEWNDWRWQLRSRIRSLADLERVFNLSEDHGAEVRLSNRPEGGLRAEFRLPA